MKKFTRLRDDTMVKRLLESRKMETMTKKHGDSEIGSLLRKKAEAEFAAAEERKRANIESKRRRAREDWDQKKEAARLQAAADDLRIQHLKLLAEQRREKQRLRKLEERQKVQERWLQIEFPVELARRCMDWYAALSQDRKSQKRYAGIMEDRIKDKIFERRLAVRDLWTPVKEFSLNWCQHVVRECMDGRKEGTTHWVKCSAGFNEIINEVLGDGAEGGRRYAPGVLGHIFKKIIPKGDVIFGPKSRTSGNFLLGHNDFIIEKAFVYGVYCLSKWLGQELFPPGIYGVWPPRAPSHIHRRPPPISVDEDSSNEESSGGAASSSK